MRLVALAISLVIAIVGMNGADDSSPKLAFPENYKSRVLYNVIDREDQKEVHEQYASLDAIEAAKAGKPLPYGTVVVSANYKAALDSEGTPVRDARGNLVAGELNRIAVMEKRPGWGAEFP